MDPETASTSLLEKARADRPEAWVRLAEEYGPSIYRWCRLDGLPPDDAADLVQEVLLCIFQGLEGFKRESPEDTFRGWIRRVARNRIIDWKRSVAVRPPEARGGTSHHVRMQQLPRPPEPDTVESIDPDMVAFCEATDRVRTSCEEQTWQIFVHYVIDGFSVKETAGEFGVSVGYVHQVRCRVLRRYRQELEGYPISIDLNPDP